MFVCTKPNFLCTVIWINRNLLDSSDLDLVKIFLIGDTSTNKIPVLKILKELFITLKIFDNPLA